jgi:DNA-binding CsgD family transcriptional regulator
MKFTDEHKEKIRQSQLAHRADEMNLICELAIQGKSTKEIAEIVGGHTPSNICKILHRRGIKAVRGPNQRKGISTNPEKISEICEMAKQGKTAQEIADHFNAQGSNHTSGHIYKILDKEGIEIKRMVGNANPQKIDEICEMYETEKIDYEKIAEFFGCSKGYILRVLINNGLREKTKIFKHRLDGYSTDKKGYVLTKLEPNDPMYCMCSKRGYVYVHRLVTARHLGRPLKDNETVHHINGVRDDYRLENLQLRQSHHGEGQVMKCNDCNSNNIISKPWWECKECGSTKIIPTEL